MIPALGPGARDAVFSVFIRGGAMALNLVTAIVLARLLEPEQYGVFAFVLAVCLLLSIPNTTAVGTLLIRELAVALGQADHENARAMGLWGLKWAFASSLCLSGAVAAAALAIDATAAGHQAAIGFAVLIVPLMTLLGMTGAMLRGLGRIVAGQLPEQLLVPVAQLLFVLAALSVSMKITSATQALALYAASSGIALLVSLVLLSRLTPKAILHAGRRSGPPVRLSGLVPLLLYGGFRYANAEFGIILVTALAGASEAGLFRVASRGAELVAFALTGFGMAIAPRLAQMYASGSRTGLRQVVGLTTAVSSIWGAVTSAVLISFGSPLISLVFGPAYIAAAASLSILCIAQLVNAATGPMAVLLNMAGRERTTAAGQAVALLVGLVAGVMAIPAWGVNGAAVASGLSIVTCNVIYAVAGLPLLGLRRNT